jgi:hypothetical protein
MSVAMALTLASGAHAQAPATTFALPGSDSAVFTQAATSARTTSALTQPMPVTTADGEWKFTVYPILAWVPLNLEIEVQGPFDLGSGGGGGGGIGGGIGGGTGQVGGKIVDKRFDGAFLAGFAATNDTWRFDFDGVYAAVGGDRVTPLLTVDVNLIYVHSTVGREIAGGVFVTGGVRRVALKYDIDFLDFATFTRKPGIWNPLVGVAYHKAGDTLELHANLEYGGFGVGADSDLGLGARLDWKPWTHFGFTAGYSLVRLEFSEDIGPFEFSAKQTIGGPLVGIGFYF